MVHEMSRELAAAGHSVSLFLVENGTFLARNGACDDLRASLAAAGVQILADDLALDGAVETGLVAGVAGTAGLVDEVQQGIAVTVDAYLLDCLDVPARPALVPEFLAAPRVVVGLARLPGAPGGLGGGVGERGWGAQRGRGRGGARETGSRRA